MKNLKLIIVLLLIGTSAFAQSKVGTTAANFLSIPVGARASGMGAAFVAVANDVSAAYWNPGGLARLPKSEFSATYSEWLVGTKLNWFGLSVKLDENNTFALSVNQLDYGEEDITTADQPNGTGQRWKASDIAFALSYSRNLTDRFSIGGTVKYIHQGIWNETANAFAVDIGLLFQTQLPGLRIGMNIANFGTEMKLEGKDLLQTVDIDPAHTGNNKKISANFDTDTWPLPLLYTVGLGMDFINTEDWVFTVATDAVYPNNQSSYLNVGSEVIYNKMLSARIGFNSLFKDSRQEGLTAGFGVQYDFGSFFAKMDYSYTDFGVFDKLSKISLSIGL